ncbi:MAG: tetratricopeptide repeat protein [Spirochaetales bacterium]|jgi:tetratricopeptide (TPR) repeat protein|nr:tetratricopeptide repeat protein [Spirochaetales bacterium]
MTNKQAGIFFFLIGLSGVFLPAQTPRELFNRGEEARLTGRYYQAIELYLAALEQNPAYLGPLKGLAEAYFALTEFQEALKYALEAQRFDSSDYELLNLTGRILLGLGRFNEAQENFARVLRAQPNNINAQFGMAELEIAQGRIQNALGRYTGALRISPENRRALLSLILLYDKLGLPGSAEPFIDQALQYYADHPQARYIAAQHYALQGRSAQAREHCRAALDLNPDYLEAGLLLSRLLMQEGRPRDSWNTLTPFLSGHRDDPMLWYTLGQAYRQDRLIEEAIHAFATAGALRSGDDMARISLENLLIQELPLSDPRRERSAAYHWNLGREYDRRNLASRAYQEFRKGLKLSPYSREGRQLLAEIFRRQGLYSRYQEELLLLVRDGADSVDLRDELEFLEVRLETSVSARYGLDQFSLARPATPVCVFYQNAEMYHPGGEEDIMKFLRDILEGYEKLSLVELPFRVNNFAEAFRLARENRSRYFVILDLEEAERSITVNARVFFSETGTELTRFRIYRTGNQRIPESLAKTGESIHALLPVFGRIAERRFDQGLLNLGLSDGIQPGDLFLVIRNGDLNYSKTAFGFEYSPESVLGDFTVTGCDDLLSEGVFRYRGFFDNINQGDYLIPAVRTDVELENPPARGLDLYQELLKIR